MIAVEEHYLVVGSAQPIILAGSCEMSITTSKQWVIAVEQCHPGVIQPKLNESVGGNCVSVIPITRIICVSGFDRC